MNSASKYSAREKYRQLVCQNSHELRELERQLQTAYNRQVLETTIIHSRIQRQVEQASEKQVAKWEENLRYQEEMRLKALHIDEQRKKTAIAAILHDQMLEKQRKLEMEKVEDLMLLKDAEEKSLREKSAEERANVELLIKKQREREEQERLVNMKKALREEEKRQAALIEKQLIEEANKIRAEESIAASERGKQIAAAEAVKQRLADELAKEERSRREREELAIRLLCAEKEEKERKMFEAEVWKEVQRREASKLTYDEVTKQRLLKEMEERELDEIYAASVQRSLEIQEKEEKRAQAVYRKQKLAVREENFRLMQWKDERRKIERAEIRAEEKAVDVLEEERMKVVSEERMKLLKSIDPRILHHLPRGCLTEEDMICLNFTNAKV